MLKNAIVIFLFTFIVLIAFLPSFSKKQDLLQRNASLEERIKELELEKAALIEENRLLDEDPVYLEKIAREKMGILREGEMVYRLLPEETIDDE